MGRKPEDISDLLKEVAATYASDGVFVGLLATNEPQPPSEYVNHVVDAAKWAGTMDFHRDTASARQGLLRAAALAIAGLRAIDARSASRAGN